MAEQIGEMGQAHRRGETPTNDSSRLVLPGDISATPRCCDKTMESRLAKMRNRLGEMIFVAVWRCPLGGRLAMLTTAK